MAEEHERHPMADSGSDQYERTYLRNVYTTMAIALYNLGVEHEHLGSLSEALEYFRRSVATNKHHLGNDSHLGTLLSEGMRSVSQKLHKQMVIINAYGSNPSTVF